ncbi:MAG TPA: thiamine phosphate synthase [Cycloclasticus sp.]|jgi:thiamine-phosphate pyrophosphorylase|nr:thiamine phosphate synthase [Cycloclasticus sp.]HIL93375.1 thiamine phosphate synthase [Cycloclasticus sp.]
MNTIKCRKGLYAITPNQPNTALLLEQIEHALQGKLALLQYRDKTSTATEKLHRAKTIHALCLKYDTPLIINDDPALALACQAEGVHLGQSDGSIQQARKLLGEKAIIGATCHHQLELAIKAETNGADYVAFGRFFHSSTKPGVPLANTQLIKDALNTLAIPIVAIGGITLENAAPLVQAGITNLAVVDNIFSQSNIRQACLKFDHLFYCNHKKTQD